MLVFQAMCWRGLAGPCRLPCLAVATLATGFANNKTCMCLYCMSVVLCVLARVVSILVSSCVYHSVNVPCSRPSIAVVLCC